MEGTKKLSLILLILSFALVGCQVYASANALTNFETPKTNFTINGYDLPSEGFGLFPKSANWTIDPGDLPEPGPWLAVNIVVLVLFPVGMITQAIINNVQKKKQKQVQSAEDGEPSDKLEEETDSESKVVVKGEVSQLSISLIKGGFILLAVQNIVILVLYIAMLAGIPFQDLSWNLLKVFSILFNLDFLAALIIAVGILISITKLKRMVEGIIASVAWIGWVGTGLYPRIISIQGIGIFGPPSEFALEQFIVGLYAENLFLITLGTTFMAVAIFYTIATLRAEKLVKSAGIFNGFGITNWAVGGLANTMILLFLTLGVNDNLTEQSIFTMLILITIFWIAKFLVTPVIGIIAGFVGSKQITKATTTES